MLNHIIRPRTTHGRFLYYSILAYLIVGISGCANPPRREKPPTSIARAMETRVFPGDLKTVLKASINSLQDMDYTIAVLNSDIGLITANRTTEHQKANLANEKPEGELTDGQKACIALGNLTELSDGETNVRVSASGEVEQDGKILSTGGVHEPEFFQKFFAGMNQGLFLDQNLPVNN